MGGTRTRPSEGWDRTTRLSAVMHTFNSVQQISQPDILQDGTHYRYNLSLLGTCTYGSELYRQFLLPDSNKINYNSQSCIWIDFYISIASVLSISYEQLPAQCSREFIIFMKHQVEKFLLHRKCVNDGSVGQVLRVSGLNTIAGTRTGK